jgi:hypothetical protein
MYGFSIFPKTIENLNVKRLYCEWDLSIVGSATAEIQLTVEYSSDDYYKEIKRLCSFEFEPIYDTEQFVTPAYIYVLGYDQTNWYAVVDESSYTVSYCLLQLILQEQIDIDSHLIPRDYTLHGDNTSASYCVFNV